MRIRVNRPMDEIEIDFAGANGGYAEPILDVDTGKYVSPVPAEVIKLKTPEGKPAAKIEIGDDGFLTRVTIPGVDALIRALREMTAEP